MLGVVLVHWQNFFGIPVYALYILAAIPCFFALYDLAVYSVESANTYTALKNMAFLNIAYCIFSLGIALFHVSSIKVAGWIYLVGEVIIVLLLARLELLVASSRPLN